MKSAKPNKSSFGTWLIHALIGLLVSTLYYGARFFRFFIGKRSYQGEQVDVLLTGTFNSAEWIDAFIKPIAMAPSVRQVILVTEVPIPDTEGVNVVKPPAFLQKIAKVVVARLLMFVWQAIKHRPLVVGGFHISINALVADLAASLSGSRSMYVCVGGPIEVQDGGLWGESRFFNNLRHADLNIESKLLRTVRQFDAVVPMGNSAREYFESKSVDPKRICPMTGGVELKPSTGAVERDTDVAFVGRLEPIKDLDVLLHTVKLLVEESHPIKVRVMGKGSLHGELQEKAKLLGIEEYVSFPGFVPSVVDELRRAKCFILTSRSEGLSLALIEAMLAGAVPVVSNVGDLGDLVKHDETGYLVDSREPAEFAGYLKQLTSDQAKLSTLSEAAYNKALSCETNQVSANWDALIRAQGSNSN